jgi:hypothetical protein
VRALPALRELACEQVLVPETEADVAIPGASLAYFDPRVAQYRTLRTPPVVLTVLPSAVAPVVAARPAGAVAKPPVANGEGPREERPLGAIGGITAAILLATGLVVLAWRRKKRKQALTPVVFPEPPDRAPAVAELVAEAERAFAANDPTGFHAAVYRALQGHLGERYGVPPQGITEDFVGRVMRPAGAHEGLLEDCAQLFAILSNARYGPGGASGADLTRTLERLRLVIDTSSVVEISDRSIN